MSKNVISNILVVAGLIALFVLGAFWFFTSKPPVQPSSLKEVPKELAIEVVDTEESRMRGLSGRTEVPDNYGMLFVFQEPALYEFWMKDMYVPIDIIWLRDDGSIAGIDHSVSPDTYPSTFPAPEPVRFVLETRAGYASDHGWKEGTVVPLSLPE